MTRRRPLDTPGQGGYCAQMKLLLRLLAGAVAVFGAAEPSIAETYTVSSATAPAFATVASATTGVTNFAMTTGGVVSVSSGSGAKVTGTTTASTVSILCVNGGGNCSTAGNKGLIKIGSTGTVTGRGQAPTTFTVASGTGTVGTVTTAGDGSIQFNLTGYTGNNQTKTFLLGMTLPITGNDAGGTTGAATGQFYVRAAKDPTTPVTGINQNATATVRRSLVVSKLSDLAFGTMLVPTATGSVIINATTGARTTSGTAPTFITGPAFGRATYTITGESGTTFSISVPATFVITNGTTNLTVTTSSSATGTQTLTGGTFSLGMGGTLPVTAATTRGQYTGSVTVTLTYN